MGMDTPHDENAGEKLTDWQGMERIAFEKARAFLKALLSHDNQDLASYSQIIKNVSGPASWRETHYGDNWGSLLKKPNYDQLHEDHRESVKTNFEKDFHYLENKLRDSTLIDLGGGGACSAVESIFPVKEYVSVDKFIYSSKDESHVRGAYEPVSAYEQESQMHIEIEDDMLDFVARVQSNSSNFMMNGIDTIILPNSDYWKALAAELMRATKEGGIVFGIGSDEHLLQHHFSMHEGAYRMINRRRDGFYRFRASMPSFFCFEKEATSRTD